LNTTKSYTEEKVEENFPTPAEDEGTSGAPADEDDSLSYFAKLASS